MWEERAPNAKRGEIAGFMDRGPKGTKLEIDTDLQQYILKNESLL